MKFRRRVPGQPPPTSCARCIHAEMDGLGRMVCLLSALWWGRCPHEPVISSAALLGGPSWFDVHREKWVMTGEPAELARMVRHVHEEAPR